MKTITSKLSHLKNKFKFTVTQYFSLIYQPIDGPNFGDQSPIFNIEDLTIQSWNPFSNIFLPVDQCYKLISMQNTKFRNRIVDRFESCTRLPYFKKCGRLPSMASVIP